MLCAVAAAVVVVAGIAAVAIIISVSADAFCVVLAVVVIIAVVVKFILWLFRLKPLSLPSLLTAAAPSQSIHSASASAYFN